MAALKIQCFLNEDQMSALTECVASHLQRCEKSELEDIDFCIDTPAIRLCVEFSIGLDNIELKQAEILDDDWNLIDADSAVLRSRLKSIIDNYNKNEQELTNYNQTLRNEQRHQLYNY